MTQSDFKVLSQQLVGHIGKEVRILEGEKKTLVAALKQSEETCTRVSSNGVAISCSLIFISCLLYEAIQRALKVEG